MSQDDFLAMWSPDNPGWKLIPHDWMWYVFWAGDGYILAVTLFGLALWVKWLFAGEEQL